MSDRVIVYKKYSGEPSLPLTVRIDWLPDGTIIPLLYWTPDGSCYQILPPCPCVPLAFLKDRGEGLRFKVRAELIASDDELPQSQCDAYLFLADKLFCQKNIVDGRYDHAGKEYIPVTLDVFPDGDYELLYFWAHGSRYMVEKSLTKEYRGSFRAGGIGTRHKVEARLVNAEDDEDPDPTKTVRRSAGLYLELNKWFVNAANPA
jgi:hypothetical protein